MQEDRENSIMYNNANDESSGLASEDQSIYDLLANSKSPMTTQELSNYSSTPN